MRRLSRALLFLEYRAYFVALFEVALIFFAVISAWLLVLGIKRPNAQVLLVLAPVLIAIRLALMARFNLFHGWWRYAGISEALDIIKCVGGSTISFFVIARYLLHSWLPWSFYIIEALVTLALLGGVRLLSRLIAESVREDASMRTQIGIIGAGFAAQMIIREINRPQSKYAAIACFDDNVAKIGIKLLGVPVVGSVDDLPLLASNYGLKELLIAVPSATGDEMSRFVEICRSTGLKFKTVPALHDLISRQNVFSQVREVNLDDLLAREPARIDLAQVRERLQGLTVMVTGAAGSIGSELCRQLVTYNPATLVCVDQNENGMFYLQLELDRLKIGTRICYSIADVGDSARMRTICSAYHVNTIFHAAAYKHVPVMEQNVAMAVRNNVLALMALLDVAEQSGCDSFVMISSDKAVNPTSIMGTTKRIGELILAARPSNGMRCVSVRFGNVLGSSGSVVRIFQDQIRRGQPLTITHPEINRFFMTIPEAVSLVLQAFAIGEYGDILVLEMGKPIRIVDLARTLVRISGKTEHEVQFVFTGLRPGEKLEEELFYRHERAVPTSCPKIKRVPHMGVDWSYLRGQLHQLRDSLSIDGPDPIRRMLKQIVPEYGSEIPKIIVPRQHESLDNGHSAGV
jgi:FlaA1/EpsC-like NDP-sugar epimerase